MTDREKMRAAFAPLHASPDTLTEVMKMTEKNKNGILRRGTTLALAAVLVLALGSFAYASDLGGIQRTLQIWRYGELTSVTITAREGSYEYSCTDANGEVQYGGGGGVAFDTVTGEARPLTEEELIDHLTAPEVSYSEDGTVVLYYGGRSVDITGSFDEDGVCYIQLERDDGPLYMTVKYQDGYATSPNKYVSPDEWSMGK